MAIVSFPESPPALTMRGSFEYGRGYGGSEYGRAKRGKSNRYAGVYQRKMHGVGVFTKSKKADGRWALSRMKFYAPPETAARIANPRRAVFATAVSTWQGLTADEKARYSKEARKRDLPGYQLFMSRWLQDHRG
jgi:hypothetical protein